ncbi:hypothetical protein GV64_06890 [Endozoicomonas elysicola]|uniref:Uncharacterized protein n=1 Tax=Endozoicomonas elysicola TaxID=305900 RepID=A0A081K8M1_9GAMM|nr:hypothetical protein GV64_06890 [Endozoicomonas elysicola]
MLWAAEPCNGLIFQKLLPKERVLRVVNNNWIRGSAHRSPAWFFFTASDWSSSSIRYSSIQPTKRSVAISELDSIDRSNINLVIHNPRWQKHDPVSNVSGLLNSLPEAVREKLKVVLVTHEGNSTHFNYSNIYLNSLLIQL